MKIQQNPDEEELFLTHVRNCLDASVDQLPSSICEQLHKARKNALLQVQEKHHMNWRWMIRVTAGATASLAIFYFVMIINTHRQNNTFLPTPLTEEKALYLGRKIDLYKDIDFYEWLANEKEVRMHG